MRSEPIVYSSARYGDGQAAQRVAADVRLDEHDLVFQIAGQAPTVWPLIDLVVGTPIRARSADAVVMAKGAGRASLYFDDTTLLAQLVRRAPHLTLRAERWRTLRPGLAVGAIALLAFGVITVLDLSPSRGIASTMPTKARVALGEQVIRTLPAQRRCVDADGQRALAKLVRRLMPNGPVGPDDVTVLDWPVLNAFAVPGNRVVLTRSILNETRTADELAAVIGHEAGHAAELHPEAGLVRSVGFWALIQMVFTGTPGAIGNIGAVLAQLGYTRSAEHAADDYALKLLLEAGVSQKGMVDFFKRMAEREERESKGSQSGKPRQGSRDLFSSHPATADRLRAIEARPAYPSTPALTEQEWASLKAICISPDEKAAAKRAAESKALADAKAAADKVAAEVRAAAAKAAEEKLAQEKAAAERAAAEKARAEQDAEAEAKRLAEAKAAEPPPDPKIDAVSKRIAEQPEDAAGYFERGQLYAGRRQFAEALRDFDRVIALKAGDVPALFWRASQHGQLKQFDQSIADYTEILRLQPKNYAALNNRGSVYRSQKKLDLAIADFTAAIAIDNRQPTALLNRALAHRDRNELDAAIVDLTAIIAVNPKHLNALVRRGETYELKANKDAAISDYRAALRLPEPATGASEQHRTALARLAALGVTP